LNKLLHNLDQNLNTLQKNLPASQYELGIKCPHAEGLNEVENLQFGSSVVHMLLFLVKNKVMVIHRWRE
jgi:hypothetical protein